MRKLANLFALGILIGLGLGIPLAIYLALDAVLYGVKIILLVLGGTGLAVLGYVGIYKWREQEEHRRRQVDGSFAMIRMKMQGGAVAIIDPNLMPAGAGIFHPQYGWTQIAPPNWEDQIEYAKTVQTTRHLGAMTPGDDAQIRTHGMIGGARGGLANSATAKWLDGAFRPQPKPAPALPALQAVDKITAPRLKLTDALSQSTGSRWIVGQSDDGALAAFEPTTHAHAAVVGSTGTGKTRSVGYALALAAIRSGWHVLILDPDGGADWSPFRTHTEWNETDRANFSGQIEAIHRFYERRASLDNPQPVLVVIEEYGDLIRQLRTASRSTADQVDALLDSILQRGRKRRMHVALIDQYPEHWSPAVIGGTKFRAVFQLGPNQGAKMEEYKAASLGSVGRFLVRGIEYNSWDASAELPAILRQLPAPTSARRIINGTATHVPASVPCNVPAPVRTGVSQEVDPIPPLPTNTTNTTNTPPMTREEREAANQEAARLFCQKHPAQGVNALARYLAELDGRPDAWRNFQSEGSRWWHIYNPRGNDYRLPNDSMDLTDDADREQFRQMLAAGTVTFPEGKEK